MHLRKKELSLIVCLSLLLASFSTKAQTFTNLHTFVGYSYTTLFTNGLSPAAGLVLSDGTLYGTTTDGGNSSSGVGTVFAISTNGSDFTILYSFKGGQDGDLPVAGLTLSGNTLYGTTEEGGASGRGTIFSVNTDGTGYTNLYNFSGVTNAVNPTASLTLSGSTLYGTTEYGGISNEGTIFAINTNGTGFTALYSFTGGTNGTSPNGGLVSSGGILYGTTEYGGTWGNGMIFAISTNGMGFTNLYSFSALSESTNSDGANPVSEMSLSNGILYGVATDGGVYGDGTVFAINTDGTSFTNLVSLTSFQPHPNSIVLLGNTLYGTVYEGISYDNGVIFAVNTDGTGFRGVYYFSEYGTSDGSRLNTGLAASGNTLYGTAYQGGTYNDGTVFAVNTNGTFTNLFDFPSTIDVTSSDGATPDGGLVLSGNTLYGATYTGGYWDEGMIFAVNIDGTGFTNLYSFTGDTDGARPVDTLLLLGSTLYGTTEYGGSNNAGTVFAISTNGTGFTNLHSFAGNDGSSPGVGLVSSEGTLYGTTLEGGANSIGTIFAVNTNGTGFTNLYSFSSASGSYPFSSLVLQGGILYGTTEDGGSNNMGTVFVISTNGTGYTNLFSFTGGTNGEEPIGNVALLGKTLYGTTYEGGVSNDGVLFAVNTDGTGYTNLYIFYGGTNGSRPYGGLVASGSTLYGTTAGGGSFSSGTAFTINTNGTGFTSLYNFSSTYGGNPASALAFSSNIVYGTASTGGGYFGEGTVFSLYGGPYIQYTASPTNGLAPLTVQFTSPGVDTRGNPITGWNWNFGDGSTSTAQNPSHLYAYTGNYIVSLSVTNDLGWLVPGNGPTIIMAQYAAVSNSIVTNGGFEDGNFTGWSSETFNGGTAVVTTANPHSGMWAAQFSEDYNKGEPSDSYLYQELTTQVGTSYLLSFWLNHIANSVCEVEWNGSVVFDQYGYQQGWTNIQLTVTATSTYSQLGFSFPYPFQQTGIECVSELDDVSLVPLPPSYQISMKVLTGGNVSLSFTGTASNSYALDQTFSLSPPINWVPVVTNSTGSGALLIFTNTPNAVTNTFWRVRSVP
jgi:uncharacterized repeat protein (TIGR03803 family)